MKLKEFEIKLKIIDYIKMIQKDENKIINSVKNYQELIEKDWNEFIFKIINKTKDLKLETKIKIAIVTGMILYKLYLENNGGNF